MLQNKIYSPRSCRGDLSDGVSKGERRSSALWKPHGVAYPVVAKSILTSRRPLYQLYPRWLLWALTLLGGCTAHYPVNDRIHQAEPKRGYYVDDPRATRRSESLLVLLAFSGGGTRAAAFSYGVLEKLARTEIIWDGRRRRLLDEVDLISSVSGGSFTAAYYGLFGDRIFEDFEEK